MTMSERSFQLAAFALTGFANFSSVGIQLGGIGGMAPNRRHDLARLGMRALFVGFTATLLNASIAGILLEKDIAAPAAPVKKNTHSPMDTAPADDATPPPRRQKRRRPIRRMLLHQRFGDEGFQMRSIELGSFSGTLDALAVGRTCTYFASSSFFARERYRHPTM